MTHQTLDRYSEYDAWGWFYDQTMGPAYCKVQWQSLQQFLLSQISQNAHLLDVCCGSEQMLHYAQRNAPEAKFHLADVRSFNTAERFDAAFSTSASLNHMMSLADLEQVLSNVYQALKPGGLFLFDLNHHDQMQKWWCNRIAEGAIDGTHAWSICPTYSPNTQKGAFTVTMYRQGPQTHWLDKPKQLVYQFLSLDLRRTKRWRHQLLEHFHQWQPTWQKSQATYEVYGYQIDTVIASIRQSGFQSVQASNSSGHSSIDSDHSAYLLCRK
jgi:SAM-dependent methyltransferase